MLVSEIMTSHVECISPDESLRSAAEMMRRLDVGALPVCHEDRIEGILTDRDIVIRAVAQGRDCNETHVSEILTAGIRFCFEDQDSSEAGQIMEEHQIRRLVVLNRDKRMVGIVSLGDLAVREPDEAVCAAALEHISEPGNM